MGKWVIPSLLLLAASTVSWGLAAEGPEGVYQRYSAAVMDKNPDEVARLLSARWREKLLEEAPEERVEMLELMAMFMPISIRVEKLSISPDEQTAVLELVGQSSLEEDKEMKGTVSLVKEEGEWRIDNEEWDG